MLRFAIANQYLEHKNNATILKPLSSVATDGSSWESIDSAFQPAHRRNECEIVGAQLYHSIAGMRDNNEPKQAHVHTVL